MKNRSGRPSESASTAFPGSLRSIVTLESMEIADVCLVFIEVTVKQSVWLMDGRPYLAAKTWTRDSAAGGSTDRCAPDVRENIADLVDQFANDYLAVNE